jgi:hypothetical protein
MFGDASISGSAVNGVMLYGTWTGSSIDNEEFHRLLRKALPTSTKILSTMVPDTDGKGGFVYKALMRLPRRVHWTIPGDKLKVGKAKADTEVPRDRHHAKKGFIRDKRRY